MATRTLSQTIKALEARIENPPYGSLDCDILDYLQELDNVISMKLAQKKVWATMSDLIKRKDAIDAMYQLEEEDIETYGCSIPEGFDAKPAVKALEALPTAEPELEVIDTHGKIYKFGSCGVCGAPVIKPDKYCSECGAKLDWSE